MIMDILDSILALEIQAVLLPMVVSLFLGLIIVPRTMLTQFRKQQMFGLSNAANLSSVRAKFMDGVAFVPIILVSLGLTAIANKRLHESMNTAALLDQMVKIMQMIAGMGLLYIIGLKDDIHGTRARNRFYALIAAAALFPMSGLWILDLHGFFGLGVLPAYIGMPLTMLFVIYVTFTFNLIDGINGLFSGLCSLALIILIGITGWAGLYVPCLISCAGLGVVFPSWMRNSFGSRKKGKAFTGSAGTLPLGYLVSFVVVTISRQTDALGMQNGITLLAMSALMLPCFDIARVVLSRIRDRRPLMLPDRNQIHHRIVRAGFSRWTTISLIMFTALLFVIIHIVALVFHLPLTLMAFLDVIVYLLSQQVINYGINRQKNTQFGRLWEQTYGSVNWSNASPVFDDGDDLQATARAILEDTDRQAQRMSQIAPQLKDIVFIPDGMNAFERNTKRFIDLIISGVCLIVFSPLFMFSYILIKLDDGGPAIYSQERIGRFGRPFYIHKFRSMRLDAEKMGPQLSHSGGDDDPRLTKVGRFLRAHHLDELPQLWDVFVGNMAFIGYRPERKYYIDQIADYDPRYYMLYQIRPGVTSFATLYNGYTDTMEKMLRRLELDLYYLGHRSFFFDMKILWLTFTSIVFGKKF